MRCYNGRVSDADQLERARAAYEAGNLVQAAEIARSLAAAEDAEVRAGAQRLLQASASDGVEVAVIAGCLLGLMAITWHYLL